MTQRASLLLKGSLLHILLTGIDGAGKSTAGRGLVDAIIAHGGDAVLLTTFSGRRTMTSWWDALGWSPNIHWQDRVETVIRVVNAIINETRRRRPDCVVIIDRGLVCQLALREARGLPRGVVLPLFQRLLRAPDVIAFFNLPTDQALARVRARATDVETLTSLSALETGYRNLPEYVNFTPINASQPTEDIVRDLLTITGRYRKPTLLKEMPALSRSAY